MRKFFVLIFLLTCVSCVRKNDENILVLNAPKDEAPLSRMIECRHHIVPLETSDSCLVCSIGKCLVTKERLFIVDNQRLNVMSFSVTSGHFLGEVSSYGRGPGEYLDIADISVGDSTLYLLSSLGKKIIKYSFDGHFLGEIRTNETSYFKMTYDQNNLYLSSEQSNHSGYDYVVIDALSGQILQRLYRFKKYNGHLFPDSNSFVGKTEDGLLLSRIYDGSLYSLINGEIYPLFSIHYPDCKVFSSSEMKDLTVGQITETCHNESVFCYYLYALYNESICYLVAQTRNGLVVNTQLLSIDLPTKEIHRHCMGRKLDDEYPDFDMGRIVSMNEGMVYSLCDPHIFQSLQKKGMINSSLHLSEGANPILISYQLKR